jgi:hypothetical protein
VRSRTLPSRPGLRVAPAPSAGDRSAVPIRTRSSRPCVVCGMVVATASIYREIILDAGPEEVWDALRDFGAVHERLVPGFVVDARLEPGW